MLRRLLANTAVAALAAGPLRAQIPLRDVRLGTHAAIPTGEFANAYDAGPDAHPRVGAPLGLRS